MDKFFFGKKIIMKCAICRNGETSPAPITVVLERGGTTLVFKEVPAEVCDNCGEEYLSAETNRSLLFKAEQSVGRGVDLELLKYAA